MKIRLDLARSAPFVWEETVALAAADLGGSQGEDPVPVTVRGRLTAADPDLWLDLDVSFRVTQPCDRCTRPATTEVRSATRLLVVRSRESRGGDEVELREDDLGIVEVAGEILDTDLLVGEQAQLELPARPLCREDCRGLCPVCGNDRNEQDCDCVTEMPDPRWSALAELKGRLRAPD